ncbi:MAG TPA: nucleotide sugar dehydrogenase [Candidatus Sumerlaeota bacterium]|nr:nucleotide sugar dehydrogenase [Candidatus Sumerlaeota bacterium]HPS02338.1 nucleotide sugar dehydrogenase [Candidatus Sumerlaeota bacterium]
MERKIAVVGLGYVGLPLAVAFGKRAHVIGFDVKEARVAELKRHEDRTHEVEPDELCQSDVEYSSDPSVLKKADFYIIAVPTPIDQANLPDLSPLDKASRAVGPYLKKGDIVVFESTVYPGVTEDFCAPILEETSGLRCGADFFLGYSPERINPGDKVHTLSNIVKIVSGQTPEVLDIVASVYERVVQAGVHRAPTIKTAEAAKVIENTQRDLNIALINELSMIFDRMGIDTLSVLEAAGTKWNFLNFRPGLVGGHCIGVDPYYLTYKASELGYHPQVILAGRRINDGMGKVVAEKAIKLLVQAGINPHGARVGVLGLTFKEDVPDLRNTRVVDILKELAEYRVNTLVHDPTADPAEAKRYYGVTLHDEKELNNLDAVILAVKHQEYARKGAAWIRGLLRDGGIVVDIKGLYSKADFPAATYWRL